MSSYFNIRRLDKGFTVCKRGKSWQDFNLVAADSYALIKELHEWLRSIGVNAPQEIQEPPTVPPSKPDPIRL